ncbi:hypothetical protein [Clostridium botulinum]|uniref:hypothetical protein n=1 Tax=Clostridium botulinum TaxID=1491 RepID=UPI000774C36A|nr:hypothetical protein [Clostridium botulinum]
MENNNTKYFKILGDIKNLNAYIEMPIYDEHPEYGTFKTEFGVPNAKKGDYLLVHKNDINFVSLDFNEVSYPCVLNLKDLKNMKNIEETTYEIFNLDLQISNKIKEFFISMENLRMSIDLMGDEYEDKNKYIEELQCLEKKLADLKEEYNNKILKHFTIQYNIL